MIKTLGIYLKTSQKEQMSVWVFFKCLCSLIPRYIFLLNIMKVIKETDRKMDECVRKIGLVFTADVVVCMY